MQPFVAALGTAFGLTSQEIADIIWLALQMQDSDEAVETTTRQEAPRPTQTKDDRPRPTPTHRPDSTDTDESPDRTSQTQSAELHLNQPNGNQAGFGQQLALNVPDARSLREPLSLARSLKPLLRRVVTGWSTVLDEAATVERIADEQLWLPVLKPALEPWLDLALVVDESESMQIWQRTIAELQRLLSHYGVFRDVRVWGLVTEAGGEVRLRPGLGAAGRRQASRRPSELIDPSGRRLILVATDCVAAGWQDGRLLPTLKLWATSGPLAIVQMLPEWLWSRTGLGFAAAVRLQGLLPGVPNQQLVATDWSAWDEVDLEVGIKVPVVTLEPEPFGAWTAMVAGKGGAWSPGFVFEPSPATVLEAGLRVREEAEESAEQRVQRFRVTASPMARRLAGLLAAAPVISLPVVRIIQDRLLAGSRQVHVAEVFLGGLLRPLGEMGVEMSPDAVQYEFLDGVREGLLESVPTSDSVNVLEEVSKFVAERLGLSLDAFAAVLRNPQQAGDRKLASQSRPFAMVTAQILRQLGGEYTRFAEELEQFNQPSLQVEMEGNLSETAPDELNEISKSKNRIPLLKQGKTQLYALHTSNPWTLPFNALVIPVGSEGTFGSFGDAFERFLGSWESRVFSQSVFETMAIRVQDSITPYQPLLVPLVPEWNHQLSLLSSSVNSRFIICATVEQNNHPNVFNAAVAAESIVRLSAEQGFNRLVLPLLGTGLNQLSIKRVAVAMLQAIDLTLRSLQSHGLEEITIVDNNRDTISTIAGIVPRLHEYPEVELTDEIEPSQPVKIISFLSANPTQGGQLGLAQEVRKIQVGLEQIGSLGKFLIFERWAPRPEDLQRLLLDYEPPQILHCFGLGEERLGGLALENRTGRVELISVDVLSGLCAMVKNATECIFLDRCYSETQAEVITQHIPYVVGTSQGMSDREAIYFSIVFYDALREEGSYENAYKIAVNALRTSIPKSLIPVLKSRFFLEGTSQIKVIDLTSYRINPGDTLYSIAEIHGISVDQLADLNSLSVSNILEVNQMIRVPKAKQLPKKFQRVQCTGVAKLEISETGEIFEVTPNDLDWETECHDPDRQMGAEFCNSATVYFESEDGKHWIEATWKLYEYPIGAPSSELDCEVEGGRLLQDFNDYWLTGEEEEEIPDDSWFIEEEENLPIDQLKNEISESVVDFDEF